MVDGRHAGQQQSSLLPPPGSCHSAPASQHTWCHTWRHTWSHTGAAVSASSPSLRTFEAQAFKEVGLNLDTSDGPGHLGGTIWLCEQGLGRLGSRTAGRFTADEGAPLLNRGGTYHLTMLGTERRPEERRGPGRRPGDAGSLCGRRAMPGDRKAVSALVTKVQMVRGPSRIFF